MKSLITLLFLFFAYPVFACEIVVTTNSTPNDTTVCYALSACKTVKHDELSSGSKSRQESQLHKSFQEFFDKRLRLTELPTSLGGFSDRATNPDRTDEFWGNEDGDRAVTDLEATHLIERVCKVESVTKTGNLFNVVVVTP